MSYLIEFDKIPWNEPITGMRYKTYTSGNQQIRLIEFFEGFIEPDWCKKGHAGVVFNGACAIDFNGSLERYQKGDIIIIPEGEESKHKIIIENGESVTLLEFGTSQLSSL